jgi:uncharacterized protein DUF2834
MHVADLAVGTSGAGLSRSRQLLCGVYALVGFVALVGTWSQNVAYVRAEEGAVVGFAMATARFWPETFATPASTSITVDLGLLCLALFALMIIESRRLGIRFVWLYILLGLLVAISVTCPLFLIARERRLAARGEATANLGMTRLDVLGLIVLGAGWARSRCGRWYDSHRASFGSTARNQAGEHS